MARDPVPPEIYWNRGRRDSLADLRDLLGCVETAIIENAIIPNKAGHALIDKSAELRRWWP